VGQFLPGIEWQLQNTNEEGYGELQVRGPNIAVDGWFDTGQIAKVDEDGFVSLAQENSSS
jgi:long-subunit acyl-CoA synthetase (AMP-forming)